MTVTTNAGDQSAGSLGWAVTTLNNAGGGSVSFEIFVIPGITLTQPLPTFTDTVTFLGNDSLIFGGDSSQTQLLFQQDFYQLNGLTFRNTGSLSSGLDAALTVDQWITDPNAFFNLFAEDDPGTSTSGGSGVLAGDGGAVSIQYGDWILGKSAQILAGDGGTVSDSGGTGDQGGAGGNASVTGGSLQVSGAPVRVYGGNGGSVVDGTGTGHQGGDGGDAYVDASAVSIGSASTFDVLGGNGGQAVLGGNGGGAEMDAGSVSLYSNLFVTGGIGGAGDTASGRGGDASVSFQSFTGFANSNLSVAGGRGGAWLSAAGNGGDVQYSGGSVSMTGSTSNFQVKGGNGGNLSPSAIVGNGGNGGGATVSITTLFVGPGSAFDVRGGNGGTGTSGAAPGNGGDGGDTSIILGSYSIGVSTNMNLTSGMGGAGGSADPSGDAGDGGNGGNLNVDITSLDLGTGSNLNLLGGTGGSGGSVSSGGTGGDGGDGGSVTLAIASVTMATGTSLNIAGGNAGFGGSAGTAGVSGSGGDAAISIGSLYGTGYLGISGAQASLQVSGGDFAGVMAGSVALQKTGSGALTLSGINTYTGGTSILAGSLIVGGGRLGSGLVTNEGDLIFRNTASAQGTTILSDVTLGFEGNSTAGNAVMANHGYAYFADNASAGTADITTTGAAGLEFNDNSTAGASTITVTSTSSVEMNDSSLGGTARFIIANGGAFDMTAHSGAVSVGSIEGAGDFLLGSNTLFTGSNDLDSNVSGVISGTGGLWKLGTGAMTLTGTNTYSGLSQIFDGGVVAGNSAAFGTGSVFVDGGAFLATTGAPLTLQVNSISINDATLRLQLGGAGASNSDSLQALNIINLTGDLNLTTDGTLLASAIGNSVTLMTASNVYGMFSNVTESLNGQGRYLPTYFSDRVELLSINPDFELSGSSSNQKAVGAALDSNYGDGRIYDLVLGVGTLTDPEFQGAADQISPAGMTGLYESAFANAHSLASQVERRLSSKALVPRNRATPDQWSGYLLGDGGLLNVIGDGNGPGYKVTHYGVGGAGVDFKPEPDVTLGLLLGYDHDQIETSDGGAFSTDGGQAGLYGSVASNGFYGWGMGEFGLGTVSGARVGYGGMAFGNTNRTVMSGVLGAGYDFKLGKGAVVGPFGSLQVARVDLEAFQEAGSLGPLEYVNQGSDSFLGRAGLRFGGDFKMGAVRLLPDLRAAFVDEFNDKGGQVDALLASGTGFSVEGSALGQTGFQVAASVELAFPGNLGLLLQYQGELGRTNLDSQRFGAGAQVGF